MSDQLALQLKFNQHAALENFYPLRNEELIFNLQDTIKNHTLKFIYLWGPHSSGKTHLLQAASQLSEQINQPSCYFSIHELMNLSPEVLDELKNFSLICIDDLHILAGKRDFEEKMFAWYNWCLEHDVVVCCAGLTSITAMQFTLDDLKSRLSLSAVYRVVPLSDEGKKEALNLHAKHRGLDLTADVSSFLLRRYSRDLSTLIKMLDLLDAASLAKQRKLTIPFVKEIIAK